MKALLPFLVFLLPFLTPAPDPAQELESQFEQDADESGDSDELEWLLFLEQHPLDLNRATVSELSSLPGLSNEEASAIVAYRVKHGRFQNVEGLLSVEGMDRETVQGLKQYVSISPPIPPGFHAETGLRLKRKTPDPLGYSTPNDSSRYLGNDLALRSRTAATFGDGWRMILGTYKDAGERSPIDAVVLGAEGKSERMHLVLGHYVLGFAHGLAFGQVQGYSRFSGKLLPYSQSKEGMRLYQGSTPGKAFLGGAGQAALGPVTLWGFASRQTLDATVDPVTGDIVTNLGEGEHRSLNEISKQSLLREEMEGGRVVCDFGERFSFGATGYLSRDDPPLSPEWNERRVYNFRGGRNSVLAADARVSLGPGRVSIEGAQSYGGGNAGAVSGVWNALPWALSLTAWHYDPDFHNAYAYGPCHSEPSNETGVLLMSKGTLPSQTRLLGYYEEYHHPWRRYYEPFPSAGFELGGEVQQKIGKWVELALRRKVSQGEENATLDDGTSMLSLSNRYQTRCEALWRSSRETSLRLRFEQVRSLTGSQTSLGSSLGFSVRQRLGKIWRLSSGITVFHTDSYDSRLYQWEEDLPGILTNAALYGKGRKAILFLDGNPFGFLALSIKYADTYYYNQTAVGSGLDARPGNVVQELGIAVSAGY